MPDRGDIYTLSPQVNISRSTTTRMWIVFSCALLAILQSAFGDNGRSLLVAFASLAAALLAEFFVTGKTYGFNKLKDGSAAASALVLTLLLPNTINPLYAAMGGAFAMIVVKYSFGGLGSNWLNPALGGWLFIRFSWPVTFTRALAGSQEYFSGPGSAADQWLGGFLNRSVFPVFSAVLPSGYIDLFSSNLPGIIADRAGLALILGISLITAFQISRTWLSVLYLAVFGVLVRMLGDLPLGNWWNGDVILGLLSGGTLVTAFILIADPSTRAKSRWGNALLVFAAAVLGVIFRYLGAVSYGCFIAVALVNSLVALLSKAERMLLYAANEGGVSRGGHG